MPAARHGRDRFTQVHQYFVGLLASGQQDGHEYQRESGSSINYRVSGGWEGSAAASNEQVARSQSYGFAARQLRKAMGRLREAAQANLLDPSPENLAATRETASHVYPAAASLLRQLNFLAESLSGMLHDVERCTGHTRDAEDGTATPLTTLARGAADADVIVDFRKFRDRLHAIAVEFDALQAAKAGGTAPEPVEVTLHGSVQPRLEPISAPMHAVERSISRTRRKYNDTCCSLIHILGIPDLAVKVQAHITVIDLYRCRRACQGCKEWCDKAIKALPRLAFFDSKLGRIETLSLVPGKIKWERPLYQPSQPTETAGQDAAAQGQGQQAENTTTTRANLLTGATMCSLNDGRFFLAGLKALEEAGPFADDNHAHHPTWQHLDRVQLYDPRDEIEGPPNKRWCKECMAAFQCHGEIDNAHNDVCRQGHPKESYTSRGTVPNPEWRKWKPLPPPPTPRACAQVVTLADGRVMMVGGRKPFVNPHPEQLNPLLSAATVKALSDNIAVATCECYDPATNTWSTLGSMNTPRRNAAVGLLPDGTVIVAGGCSPKVRPNTLQPAAGPAGGGAALPAAVASETTVPYPVALKTVETYDPATDRWTRHPVILANARAFCRGVVFPDGRFGVIGGGEYPDEDTAQTSSTQSAAVPWSAINPMGPQALVAEGPGATTRDRLKPREVSKNIEVIDVPTTAPHGPWYGAPDVVRLGVSNAASTCIGGCLAGIAYKVNEPEPEPVEYEHEHERINAEAEAEAAAKKKAEEDAITAAEGTTDADGTDIEESGTGLWNVQSEDHYSNVDTEADSKAKMRSVKLFGASATHTYLACSPVLPDLVITSLPFRHHTITFCAATAVLLCCIYGCSAAGMWLCLTRHPCAWCRRRVFSGGL